MQNQSKEYFDTMYTASVVRSSISGTIVTPDGDIYNVEDADIIPGSLGKNNKCVNGNSFEFGTVYQGELNVTLKKTFDRYRLLDSSISFTEHRVLQDGSIEDVTLGTFYIASADKSKKLTTIKAVDSMGNLDINVEDDIAGTPYDLLVASAEKCGIALAQTREEIAVLPNGNQIYAVSADTTDTYRDLVAYLGMITGTFATINNENKLELRTYALQNSIEVPASKRANGSTVIADYVTYYKGVQARFIAQENYAPYSYIDETRADGLVLDLGDIPIVRGLPETKNAMLQSLFEGVIKKIRYIPAEFTLVTSDAALELGDRIGIAGEDAESYITSYDWIYHGSEKIKGVGDNPRLKVSGDRTSKQMAALEEQVSAKNIIVHTYINVSPYTLKDQEKEIISINYAATGSGKLIFIATVPFTMETDGYISFSYYLDSVLIPEDTVRQYAARGEHFVTLSNNKPIEKDSRHTLAVKACTQYYESTARQQAAKIAALEKYASTGKYTAQSIDTTLPVAHIATNSIRAALYAQGLAGTEEWDGTINISEYVTPMELPMLPLGGFTIQGSLRDTTGPSGAIAESIAAFDLFSLPIVGFQASPAPNRIVTNYTFDTDKSQAYLYNRDYVTADETYRLRTAYEFAGRQQDIDEGTLQAVTLSMSDFAAIKSIEWSTDEGASSGAWKYLICQGDALYNISDGDLSELPDAELTADSFAAYGNDNPPTAELLQGLSEPQVLCWAPTGDSQMDVTAQMIAIPQPQTILSASIDLTHETIKGIESMTATCDEPLILAVSADHKETWKAWSGTDWITMAEDYSGMSKEALEAVTVDQWEQLCSGADALYIRAVLMGEEQSISQIYISFAN